MEEVFLMNFLSMIASRVLAVILACTSILTPLNQLPLAEESDTSSTRVAQDTSTATHTPSAEARSSQSSAAPTAAPTEQPTAVPTAQPTTVPTEQPTAAPTEQPTAVPTAEPTAVPTEQPTVAPTAEPTVASTATPEPPKSALDQYDHTTSIYANDNETLLRVEYYDNNNKLTHYSVVTDFDSSTTSYTEKIYTYDNDTQTEILQRTDTYVNGVLDNSK